MLIYNTLNVIVGEKKKHHFHSIQTSAGDSVSPSILTVTKSREDHRYIREKEEEAYTPACARERRQRHRLFRLSREAPLRNANRRYIGNNTVTRVYNTRPHRRVSLSCVPRVGERPSVRGCFLRDDRIYCRDSHSREMLQYNIAAISFALYVSKLSLSEFLVKFAEVNFLEYFIFVFVIFFGIYLCTSTV